MALLVISSPSNVWIDVPVANKYGDPDPLCPQFHLSLDQCCQNVCRRVGGRGMASVIERIRAWFLGKDVFVSYSRADSADYALRLASDLADKGFSCVIDQWGTEPGTRIPGSFLRELRRCRAMVVIASRASVQSSSVEQEIEEFRATRGIIVAVDLDKSIAQARWWPRLEGLPVAIEQSPHVPSTLTIERICDALVFRRRDQRLQRMVWAATAVLVALLVASGGAGVALASLTQRLAVAQSNMDRQKSDLERSIATLKRAEDKVAKLVLNADGLKTEIGALGLKADAERARAEAARGAADAARAAAVRARGEAVAALKEAESAQDYADVTRAIGFARANLDPQPAGSVALATEASNFSEARGAASGKSLEILLAMLSEVGGRAKQAHQDQIGATTFAADGKLLVSISRDGWLKGWHIEPEGWGSSSWAIRHEISYPDYAALSHDSRWLAVRGMRHASLWHLAPSGAAPTMSWSASKDESGLQPFIAMDDAGKRLVVATRHDFEVIRFSGATPERKRLFHGEKLGNTAISGNGRYAALVVEDSRVLTWNLDAPGQAPLETPLVVPEGDLASFWNGPTDLAISNDGKLLAAGADHTMGPESLDSTVKIWRLGQSESTPVMLPGSRGHIWISPDSSAVVTGGHTALLWTLGTAGKPAVTPLASGSWLGAARFTPDGKHLALGYGERQVAVWSRRPDGTWRQEGTNLRGLESGATSISIDPEARYLVVADRTGMLRLWQLDKLPDLQGVRTLGVTQSIGNGVYGVDVGLHGNWIVGRGAVEGSDGIGAELWKREGAGFRRALVRTDTGGESKLSPDERYFVSSGLDGEGLREIRLWSLDKQFTETLLGKLPPNHFHRPVDFSPDGRWLAAKLDDERTRVWDLRSPGFAYHDYPGGSPETDRFLFSADASAILLKAKGKPAFLVRLLDNSTISVPQSEEFGNFSFDPTSNWLAGLRRKEHNATGEAALWRLTSSGATRERVEWHVPVRRFEFGRTGTLVAASGETSDDVGEIAVIRLADLTSQRLPAHRVGIIAGLSGDGRWLVTRGEEKNQLAAWALDATAPAPSILLDGYRSADPDSRGQEDLEFSPGGRWMLMRDINGSIATLWDLQSPSRYGTLLAGHKSGVWTATFAKDDSWLVTASGDGTAMLWFLKDGTDGIWSLELRGHSGEVDSIHFLDDNSAIFTASAADGTVRAWPLSPGVLRSAARDTAGRNLHWNEWTSAFPNRPYRRVFPDLPVSDETIGAVLREAERGKDTRSDFGLVAALARESDNMNTLNRVCWRLALLGHSAEALPVCDRAVSLYPRDLNLRDSRGVARIIAGDLSGAREDLEAALGYKGLTPQERAARQSWLEALRQGRNPFAGGIPDLD